MTEDQIKAIAEECEGDIYSPFEDIDFIDCYDESDYIRSADYQMSRLKSDVIKETLQWLNEKYCIVEREKVKSNGESHVDYAAYRLDLAKEIALRLIDASDRDTHFVHIFAKVSVDMTNEIVKRLKETEE